MQAMEARYIRPRDLASTKTKPGRWPVSTATLWRWVTAGILPPPVKLGPQIAAWPIDVIEAHEAAQAGAVRDTAQKAAAGVASVAKRQVRRTVGVSE
jgi:predicted DNA-binding transcriptional regulator AlpA